MGTVNFVKVFLDFKKETEKAMLFTDGENDFWLPKSQIMNQTEIAENEYELDIPEWLAIEKGLV